MKLIVICLLLSTSLGAQAQTDVQTFTSPDGTYQFSYPAYFVPCSPDKTENSWAPDDCQRMIPTCPHLTSAANPACVAYPKSDYKNYPEFETATFSVAELRDLETEGACLKAPDPRSIPKNGKTTVLIHGLQFKVFEEGSGALGSSVDTRDYRAFHEGKCYELVTAVTFVSTGLEEPYKHLSKSDWKKLDTSLWQVAETFRLLK